MLGRASGIGREGTIEIYELSCVMNNFLLTLAASAGRRV